MTCFPFWAGELNTAHGMRARVKKKGNRDIEKEEREEEKEEETIDFCAMARRERDRESRINDEQQ